MININSYIYNKIIHYFVQPWFNFCSTLTMVEIKTDTNDTGCARCSSIVGPSHAASYDHIDDNGNIIEYKGCYVCHSCWISFPKLPHDRLVLPATMPEMIACELHPGTFWFQLPDLPELV